MPHQCTDCGRRFEDGSKEMLSGCPDCGGNKFQFHPDGVDADSAGDDEPPEPPEPAVDSTVARTVGNAATAVRDLIGGSSPPEPPEMEDEQSSPSITSSASDRSPAADRSDRPADAAGTVRPETTGNAGTDSATDSWNAAPAAESASAGMAQTENDAQASARSEVVSPEDLPSSPNRPTESPQRRDAPTVAEQPSNESKTAARSERSQSEREERPALSELREELNEQFESIRVLEPGQYELNLMSLYDREEYIIALQEDGKYTIQVPERWEA